MCSHQLLYSGKKPAIIWQAVKMVLQLFAIFDAARNLLIAFFANMHRKFMAVSFKHIPFFPIELLNSPKTT
jgi:hypothetical protein